ncbi:putative receptor protein kinase TMK1-like, partial [Trifolium medium]|nr:putative receptor protein kinase TMK1-like [Trifolium medium]
MLQISFFLISIITATVTTVVADNDDDSAVMLSLLKALKQPPSGWSSDTQFCQWDKNRIKCDSSNRRVTEINLSSQNLVGTLPSNLNSLTQLTHLDLQNNSFSGPLPSLANLSSLTIAYLGNNQFNAVPPSAFSGLTSLQQL